LECIKCHGETAIGDGEQNIYDQWTEEVYGKTPQPEDIEEFTVLGAHPPRNLRPRNLRLGVYRGGRRPVDLFWRVRNGIDGTGMPGQELNVSSDDIWAVIEYVRSLPYESISQPHETTENVKEIR
jgi:mono/diheme cytochrome c family protein